MLGRGLRTRLLVNVLHGALFSVVLKLLIVRGERRRARVASAERLLPSICVESTCVPRACVIII